MNSEVVDVNAPVAATAEAPKAAAVVTADTFEEFSTIEVEGNFRGYWRDVPEKDEAGNVIAGKTRRMFKLSRSVKDKRTGAVVRTAGWITEADAKKWGLVDGVKYHLRFSAGETLTPSKQNGDPRYVDEYSYGDVTILEVVA